MKIDFDDLKARIPIEAHARRLIPGARRIGSELQGLNPMRGDSSPGSFSINVRTGLWADFAAGASGGDIISLQAYLRHNGDNVAAAKELMAEYGDAEPVKLHPKESRPIVMPVPADVPACTGWFSKYGGAPSRMWDYRDEAGNLLMHVARYDPPDARKQIVPWSWDGQKWRPRGITGGTPRPLYGLDRLGDDDRPVVIVEGEKAADAGQRLLHSEGYAVLSWLGGANTADRVNVRPLAGRVVLLWPDRDSQKHPTTHNILPMSEQPGIAAMRKLAAALRGVAAEVAMVGYDLAAECDGWDIADGEAAGWTRIDARKYLKENTGDVDLKSGVIQQGDGGILPWEAVLPGSDYSQQTASGTPLCTSTNVMRMCNSFGINLRYNKVKRKTEILFPFNTTIDRDNIRSSALTMLIDKCAESRMPVGQVQNYVAMLASRNPYNPVAEWIDSEPWDGVSRIEDFCNTVESDSRLKDRLMLRWCLSGVAAIYKGDDFEAHGVLVFVGEQGIGKTRWAKKLVGPLRDTMLTGTTIKPEDKDSVIRFASHWIVELGELDGTFRKSDIASLKAFITNSMDTIRLPYAPEPSELQRRTIAFASVNEPQFLVDDTGNRRWWTIPVKSVDYMHDINMQQFWAEMKALLLSGEQYWLTDAELHALNESNKSFQPADPMEEILRAKYDMDARGVTPMTATAVLVALGFDPKGNKETRAIAKVLRRLKVDETRNKRGIFFNMPPARVY
ncbi:VapE domain-containing protein [Nguyenibacter vanlangensis]|uniref:VapE domain-containing protein n=1 Tax=Nguyenibacter vanlangensis TaxID=1216886 RepID=A0ABZ3D1W8_9PROT